MRKTIILYVYHAEKNILKLTRAGIVTIKFTALTCNYTYK